MLKMGIITGFLSRTKDRFHEYNEPLDLDQKFALMKEIEGERARSFRRGFLQGLYAAFCAARGNLAAFDSAGEEIQQESPFRLITGRQLDLFE